MEQGTSDKLQKEQGNKGQVGKRNKEQGTRN